MERLTKRTPVEFGYAEYMWNGDVDEEDAINRLAAYEDTGLEPKQVRKIANVLQEVGQEYNCRFEFVAEVVEKYAKYVDAERNGRLVLMPCKVGDTVYIRRYSLAQKQNIIIEARVAAVKVFRTGFQIDCVTHNGAVNKCEWGRQCFATRAEAEAALKEVAKNERQHKTV